MNSHLRRARARGAPGNPPGRFQRRETVAEHDGWDGEDDPLPLLRTTVAAEKSKTIITRNASPDVPFEQSINPYRGCEHGCVYCYARPAHAYMDLSPGLDFETRLFYKPDGPRLLREELSRRGYRCKPIAFGTNTDPYQPAEQRLAVTRELLKVLVDCRHPFTIVTKSALIERDLDLIATAAGRGLSAVMISITTLDDGLKRSLEPRAASPRARLRVVRRLCDAGIPVGVLAAPIIPAVNDGELETILEAAAGAGASSAAYILLRLPNEVRPLFIEWLEMHLPQRADHVMSLIRQMRGGRDNDPRFGHRMRGDGAFADLVARRFAIACRKFGLTQGERTRLDCSQFVKPPADAAQQSLF
jgi:DNA repair photolyase